jgi:hypothetical protein
LLKLVTALPAAPTVLALNNGANATAITVISKLIGQGGTYRLSATVPTTTLANSFTWELPACVTRVTSMISNTPVEGLDSSAAEIFVRFNGINPAAGSIYFGVKAVNNVGPSVTSNSAAVPASSSTAKLLKLVTAAPAAPATLVLNELGSTTAVTVVSKYIGTSTTLKLTAGTSVLASSYEWTLQTGVNRVDEDGDAVAGLTSTDPFIYVNFTNVPHENTAFSLVLGVTAVNGVGFSTVKPLTVTAGLPTAVGTVAGSLKICATTASSVPYTIAAVAANAINYDIIIVGCTECTITAEGETSLSNQKVISAVANATFTVNYPAGFIVTTTNLKKIAIVSLNNVGFAEKLLTLTNVGAICGGRIAPEEVAVANEFSVVAYPNPSSDVFTLDVQSSSKGATGVQVYDMTGRLIENRQVNSDSVEVGRNYASGIYNVIVNQGANVKTLRVIKQ